MAAALAAAEVAIVVLAALPWTARAGLVLAAAVLAAFTAGTWLAVARGAGQPCQCFGASAAPLGRLHVLRDLRLCLVAAAGAAAAGAGATRAAGVALSLIAGLAVALLVVFLDDLAALFSGSGDVGPGLAPATAGSGPNEERRPVMSFLDAAATVLGVPCLANLALTFVLVCRVRWNGERIAAGPGFRPQAGLPAGGKAGDFSMVTVSGATQPLAGLARGRSLALEAKAEADLILGRCDGVVAELSPWLAAHPFREHMRAMLMIALYRLGCRAAGGGPARRPLTPRLAIGDRDIHRM